MWAPRFTASFEGHLNLQSGPDESQPFSAVEAFLRYHALPTGPWRLSAKAGRFYPPISYEHDGPVWSMSRTITPSAVNSWIGEEVIVIGAEARAARAVGDHFVDFRASAFGFNDAAGALISFRGCCTARYQIRDRRQLSDPQPSKSAKSLSPSGGTDLSNKIN